MLKPKKRKDHVYLMRATNGGYVFRSQHKRRVLTQDAIDGILLAYDPDYNYPNANCVVRAVLNMVYRNKQRYPMKKEFFWSDFRHNRDAKNYIAKGDALAGECNWSEKSANWLLPKLSEERKAAIAELEIKGVQLRSSKLSSVEVSDLIKEFGDIAEQQLIERFNNGEKQTEEQYEEMQRIGRLMFHRALEKANC